MSDDDDISVIALSDDEGSRPEKKAPAAAVAAQGRTTDPKAGAVHGGSKTRSSSGDGRGSSRSGQGGAHKAHVAVERVYEDDEDQQEDQEGGGAYGDEDGYDEYEDDDEEGRGGYRGDKVLDEEGLQYISNRFASRQTGGSGPSTWLEVDEDEIREVGDVMCA